MFNQIKYILASILVSELQAVRSKQYGSKDPTSRITILHCWELQSARILHSTSFHMQIILLGELQENYKSLQLVLQNYFKFNFQSYPIVWRNHFLLGEFTDSTRRTFKGFQLYLIHPYVYYRTFPVFTQQEFY